MMRLGCPGFGSSNFEVYITELVDGMINVIHADFNQMINTTVTPLSIRY
jgi:hypothetical protein